MQAGVQSAGRPGVAQATGELDLGALGRALWRKKRLIIGLTLLAAAARLRRRQLHHAAIQVGSAGADRDPREHLPAAGGGEVARARHHRRSGGGDQPGAAHPVARSRARGDQEAQARASSRNSIRCCAARRPSAPCSGIARHRQGSDGDDARGAGAQELLRPAGRVPGRQVARDRDRVRVGRIRSSPRRSPTRSPRAIWSCSRRAKQDQTRSAGTWLSGEIEKLRAKVAEAEGQGRGVSRQDQSVHRHQQHDAVEPAARRPQRAARRGARAEGRRRGEGADDPRAP